MRQNRATPFSPKRVVVVCEGDCESWYVQMLRRNEPSLGVTLRPEIPQKKKRKELFEQVKELAKYYDKVFWIVDYDAINNEERKAKAGKETPRQEFKKYVQALEKYCDNVIVIINNPCLEFWLLLHFEETGKFFDTCEKAAQQLKKYLLDYEKTARYYTKKDKDIYLRLKSFLKTALAHSKKLKDFDLDHSEQAVSQMHLLFESEEIKEVLVVKEEKKIG